MSIKLKLYNGYPCTEVSLQLRGSVNQALKNSLFYLSEVTEDALDVCLHRCFTKNIENIDASNKIHPFLFMFNAKLIELIQQSDVPAIISCLKILVEQEYVISTNLQISQSNNLNKYVQEIFYESSSLGLLNKPKFSYVDLDKFEQNKTYAIKALEFIKDLDFDFFGEINAYISSILVTSGLGIKAGSSSHIFGMIYVEQSYIECVEHMIDIIIHETAHYYLHAISFFDPILNNDQNELYEAPLRTEKRPLIGIYHATFVIARLIVFFKKVLKQNRVQNLDFTYIENKISFYKQRYDLGYETLLKYGKFTEIGQEVIKGIHKFVR